MERFIGTIRRERYNRFIYFGKTRLERVTKIWLEYEHRKRPHQGRNNELLVKPKAMAKRKKKAASQTEAMSLADDRCEQQLGGLLKSYSRKAAYPSTSMKISIRTYQNQKSKQRISDRIKKVETPFGLFICADEIA